MRDHYEVLGVGRQAGPDEIKKSYRRLALQHHPDRNQGEDASFREVNEAYECLSDPEKKANYDRWGHARGPEPAAGFRADLFADLFGHNPFDHGPVARNIVVPLAITLEEAASGCRKEVAYQRKSTCRACHGSGGRTFKPCPSCAGRGYHESRQGPFLHRQNCGACRSQGRVTDEPCDSCRGTGYTPPEDRTETIDVPRGVHTGVSICFQGEGETSHNGQVGHLYVQVLVQDHPTFARNGDDLVCPVPLTYTQLVLGDTVEVPTLDGTRTCVVPPGTKPGAVIRLSGSGLPLMRSPHQTGDLLVRVDLVVASETEDTREAIRNLARCEPRHVWTPDGWDVSGSRP